MIRVTWNLENTPIRFYPYGTSVLLTDHLTGLGPEHLKFRWDRSDSQNFDGTALSRKPTERSPAAQHRLVRDLTEKNSAGYLNIYILSRTLWSLHPSRLGWSMHHAHSMMSWKKEEKSDKNLKPNQIMTVLFPAHDYSQTQKNQNEKVAPRQGETDRSPCPTHSHRRYPTSPAKPTQKIEIQIYCTKHCATEKLGHTVSRRPDRTGPALPKLRRDRTPFL